MPSRSGQCFGRKRNNNKSFRRFPYSAGSSAHNWLLISLYPPEKRGSDRWRWHGNPRRASRKLDARALFESWKISRWLIDTLHTRCCFSLFFLKKNYPNGGLQRPQHAVLNSSIWRGYSIVPKTVTIMDDLAGIMSPTIHLCAFSFYLCLLPVSSFVNTKKAG